MKNIILQKQDMCDDRFIMTYKVLNLSEKRRKKFLIQIFFTLMTYFVVAYALF